MPYKDKDKRRACNRMCAKEWRENHPAEVKLRNDNQRRKYIKEHRCCRCSAPLIEDEVKYCFSCRAISHQMGMKGVLKYETAN